MKKLLTLGTALLSTLALVACNNGGNGGTKITIWATAAEEAVVKAVVDDYNAKQTDNSKKFDYEFVPVAEGDAGTTLAKDPTVDGAPALFLCADDHISNLQSLNIVSEVVGTRKDKIVSELTEVSVMGATLNDKLYGFPVTSDNGYFLWYNKGIEGIEDKIDSLEDLLAFAKEQGKSVLMDVPNGFYANSFIMSPQANGLDSLYWTKDADGKVSYTSTWDNDTGAKVSEYIGGLLTPYYADGTLQIGSNDVITANMTEDGSLIAAVSGTWMESQLLINLGDELGAAKLPSYHIDDTAYQMASFSGSKIYCLNKTRPVAEQKVAADLAELLISKEAQLKRFEIRKSIPCNKEALEEDSYKNNVSIGAAALAEQNEFGCVQAKTAEGRYWDIGKAIGQAYIEQDSQLVDADGNQITWKQFLETQMNILRLAQ